MYLCFYNLTFNFNFGNLHLFIIQIFIFFGYTILFFKWFCSKKYPWVCPGEPKKYPWVCPGKPKKYPWVCPGKPKNRLRGMCRHRVWEVGKAWLPDITDDLTECRVQLKARVRGDAFCRLRGMCKYCVWKVGKASLPDITADLTECCVQLKA